MELNMAFQSILLPLIFPIGILTASLMIRPSWVRKGDVANAFVFANLLAFLVCIILQNSAVIDIFDLSFQQDGFCVANPGTLLDSHMLSFYSDTVNAIILALLASKYHGMAGFEPVMAAAAGVFAHGLGHVGLWTGFLPHTGATGWERLQQQEDGSDILMSIGLQLVGLSVFFVFLFRSAPAVSNSHATFHGILHGILLTLVCPPAFGFTYVQTVTIATSVMYELSRSQASKDDFYDLSALAINVPVGIVSWVEGLACENALVHAGGHFWYDTSIPLSMYAYYYLALAKQPKEKEV
jgi:hypothetical protein